MRLRHFVRRRAFAALACATLVAATANPAVALRFSTGAVGAYTTHGGAGPDLDDTIPEAEAFRRWLSGDGHVLVNRFTDENVFGAMFRDGTDRNPGGSDNVDLYYYAGHGHCEDPPAAASQDWIVTHGKLTNDWTDIGASSRWGNDGGRARYMLLDASCPMDLVSIRAAWFPVFRGLHIATGHSGDLHDDTVESSSRGDDFAHELVRSDEFLFAQSVGGAWMDTGLEDVQDNVCPVVIAAGNTRSAAIKRRDFEKIDDPPSSATGIWRAWRWRCTT
jgi:uncharacterized protein DUF6345